jgi:Ca2+-binding RTX toxin-like protein
MMAVLRFNGFADIDAFDDIDGSLTGYPALPASTDAYENFIKTIGIYTYAVRTLDGGGIGPDFSRLAEIWVATFSTGNPPTVLLDYSSPPVDLAGRGLTNFWDGILAGNDSIRLGGRLESQSFGTLDVTAFGDFQQNSGGATVCGNDSIVIESSAVAAGSATTIVRITGDVQFAEGSAGPIICGDDVISAAGRNFAVSLYGDAFIPSGASTDAFIRYGDDVLVGGSGNDGLFGDAGLSLVTRVWGGSDRLYGGDGNDSLDGAGGDDFLFGENGDDTLDAGLGSDRLEGGLGGDTYIVDRFDIVIEKALEGVDTVVSSDSRTIDANVEKLALSGSAANAFGDERNNVLEGSLVDNAIYGYGGADLISGSWGNDRLFGGGDADTISGGLGNDILDGGTGLDRMSGGTGNDTYGVDNVADIVTELTGEGTDRVNSVINYALGAHVENLALYGAALNGTGNNLGNQIFGNANGNSLRGLDGADRISGAAGNDFLRGGRGADTLYGGTGRDGFVFDTPAGPGEVDTIADFVAADDTIWLDNAVFPLVGLAGPLAPGLFKTIGSGGALDSNDIVAYDISNGRLYVDLNGAFAGGWTQIATLAGRPALTAADFTVY